MAPLILTKRIYRNESTADAKPFSYDYSIDLNIRNGKPFIECNSHDSLELVSKTATFRERDDEDIECSTELMTKTEVTRERDDEELLLEAETLTKVHREGTDLESEVFMEMELLSKTFADRERDDEDDSYYYQ